MVDAGDTTTGIPVASTVCGFDVSASSVQIISYKPFVAEIAPKVVELIGQITGSETIAIGAEIFVEIDTF